MITDKLMSEATKKWEWYEKEFFIEAVLTEKQRTAIIAAMVDFAIKKITDEIIDIMMKVNEEQK